MNEKQSATELQKQYFISLVTMMSMSTMQQLGKIKNPATGKAEVNREAAQATIDMLDMLEAKTKGNLDNEEAKLLKDTLSALKLNYVETMEMEKKKAPEIDTEEKPKKEKEEQPFQQPRKEASTPTDEKHKNPKFHKSYE